MHPELHDRFLAADSEGLRFLVLMGLRRDAISEIGELVCRLSMQLPDTAAWF